jgi:hypothetical protein
MSIIIYASTQEEGRITEKLVGKMWIGLRKMKEGHMVMGTGVS